MPTPHYQELSRAKVPVASTFPVTVAILCSHLQPLSKNGHGDTLPSFKPLFLLLSWEHSISSPS